MRREDLIPNARVAQLLRAACWRALKFDQENEVLRAEI